MPGLFPSTIMHVRRAPVGSASMPQQAILCSHHEFGPLLTRQARAKAATAAGEIQSALTTRR